LIVARTVCRFDGTGHMTEGSTLSFSDPDAYAAAFGDARINLTTTGAGDFAARLTRVKLQHMDVYLCRESLARIAYISLPAERTTISFPVGTASTLFDGLALRKGEMIFHGHGEHMHQRSNGSCEWGFISLSREQLAGCGKALTGWPITAPRASKVLRPAPADASRFRRLFRQACRFAEAKRKLIERPEVGRALEQELLHAVIHCLATESANLKTRHNHAALLVRFEETLSKHIDQKINMSKLCAEIGVAERTLRMCCAEFLGVSPTRYLLLQRLNKARSALRRADPSTASVAQVARDHQFLELGRFAVTYRATFGESPSVTLHRAPQT
jgi:AraC-like DNA-binding protein